MKRINFLIVLICSFLSGMTSCKAQSNVVIDNIFSIPLVGNAFEIGFSQGRSTIGKESAVISAENRNPTRVYFKLLGTGKLFINISGKADKSATVEAKFLNKSKSLSFSKTAHVANLGDFEIKAAGYYYVDLLGKDGVVDISTINISGSAVEAGVIYCNDPNYYYWARRGPSCHLAYTVPTKENVSYYYNEIVVPKGEDVIGSYYMANGFGEGYFGMQVNSATERRILFSVWSPFHTDNPRSIPDDQKIVLLKKGADVHTGEFGNEGSGGQSYLKYNWEVGKTYKFLLKGVPDGKGNTDYTAWLGTPDAKEWRLIASFKRPKTDTYLKRFHSFLENFNPNQGYLTRQVNFNNQWVYDGTWKKVESAKLTVDATYNAKQRVDATGGTTKTGYYLKMGGFFNEIEKPSTLFHFTNESQSPQIDFTKLP